MSQDTLQSTGTGEGGNGSKGQIIEAASQQTSTMAPLQGGSGSLAKGTVLVGGGFTSSGVGGMVTSGAGTFVGGGGGSLVGTKSVISIQSKRLADDVNHVYDRQILYTTKIQFQRSRIEDLTFRISKAEKELEDKRKSAGPETTQTVKGGVSATEREIHRIENRLQQTLTKASMLDAANTRRKECVDSLRREKMAEAKAKKRLEAELESARVTCSSTTRLTQQMIDDKEKTRREIELLKQEVVKDLEAFRGEFQGMADGLAAAKTATQESNAKLEYMTRTRVPPATSDEDAIALSSPGEGDASSGKPGPAGVQPLSRAQRLRQQSNMSFWLILKKKNDLQAKAARVQELRAMLEKISAATSLATLDDFVPVMLEAEDENYNLFKLINELNKELEELDREKSRVNDEIDRLTQAGQKRDQQAVKMSLQQQIDRSRSTAEVYDLAYSRDVEVIKSIEDSLISVFNKVGSSDKAVSKQLLAMGVTDRNILMFLAQIEEQIEHIVQVYNAATDNTAVSNVRRPATPVVNQATGERAPSMCPPNPPSSDTIDDTLGTMPTEEDADGAYRPINTTRVAVSMKEQILRMPQGTHNSNNSNSKGGVQGAGKSYTKTRQGSFGGGQTGRTKTVGLPPEKAIGGADVMIIDSVGAGTGGISSPKRGSGS